MSSTSRANRGEGLTLRQAALIAGFGYLLGPVTYAEFSIYPKLVIPTNIELKCSRSTPPSYYGSSARTEAASGSIDMRDLVMDNLFVSKLHQIQPVRPT
jgi:hypothetical protein